MFWGKKNKKNKTTPKTAPNKKTSKDSGVGKDESQRLREEALANMQAARENIGEETLDRIAAAMTKKQQSSVEQAKQKIQSADPDKVLDEILYMLEDKE